MGDQEQTKERYDEEVKNGERFLEKLDKCHLRLGPDAPYDPNQTKNDHDKIYALYQEFRKTIQLEPPESYESDWGYPYHKRAVIYNQFRRGWLWFKGHEGFFYPDVWNTIKPNIWNTVFVPIIDGCVSTESNLSSCVNGYMELQGLESYERSMFRSMPEMLRRFLFLLDPMHFYHEDARILPVIMRAMRFFRLCMPHKYDDAYVPNFRLAIEEKIEKLINYWEKDTNEEQCDKFLNEHITPGTVMKPFKVQLTKRKDKSGRFFALVTFARLMLQDFDNIKVLTLKVSHEVDQNNYTKWVMEYNRFEPGDPVSIQWKCSKGSLIELI